MKKLIVIFLFFSSFAQAASFFNDRIAVQGFLKISGAPLNDATGFPMRFIIKRNSTPVWCQDSASNVVVTSGIFNQTLSGLANCSSLTNPLDGSIFAHAANTDVFTVDVVVDYLKNGFSGGDDASFAGIDLVSAPLAIYSHYANVAAAVAGVVPLANGGTGGTDAATARTNLELGTLALLSSPGNATQVLKGDGTFGTLPTATLAGDVSGNTAASVVDKIKGRPLSATVPTTGQVLTWNGTSWDPSTPAASPITSVAGKTGVVTLVTADITDADSANTANMIVKRDGSGNFSAGTITANLTGNATNVTGTVALANGGTGATDAATARTNLGAAASGVNTDITSINGSARQASVVKAPGTAGSNTAYTLTNSPALTSLPTGTTVFFRPHANNNGATTLDVDGLGAKEIYSSLTGTSLAAGDLLANKLIEATFDGTNWIATIPPQMYSATALACTGPIAARSFVVCSTISAPTVNAGDIVNCSPSADIAAGGQVTWSAVATAANISIRLGCNNSASTCALTARNWKCIVNK